MQVNCLWVLVNSNQSLNVQLGTTVEQIMLMQDTVNSVTGSARLPLVCQFSLKFEFDFASHRIPKQRPLTRLIWTGYCVIPTQWFHHFRLEMHMHCNVQTEHKYWNTLHSCAHSTINFFSFQQHTNKWWTHLKVFSAAGTITMSFGFGADW